MEHLVPIPNGLTVAQLTEVLNARFRDLQLIMEGVTKNPAESDQNMANRRVTDMADPQGDLDGVNLRALQKAIKAIDGAAGVTITINFPGGFLVGTSTRHNMVFTAGELVSTS